MPLPRQFKIQEFTVQIRTFLRLATLQAAITASLAFASIIHVPLDQPTIQAGINAASSGDTVLVAPGTYIENINFNGKAITVISASGAKATTIDGGQKGPVVTFSSGESSASTLRGFTIQNGNATAGVGEGGGISVEGSSPTILNNVIVNNQACEGDGIGVGFGSPVIKNNKILKNFDSACGGIGGGGIGVRGASAAQIIQNTISGNRTGSYGGGIALWSGNAVLIENNFISGNTAYANGGGISMFNDVSSVAIVQNVIWGNWSGTGNGVYWSNPPSLLVNNTIADSPKATGGSTVWADGFCCSPTMVNNIIVAAAGATNAFTCNYGDFPPQSFIFNDAFSTNGPAFGGMCTDQTGKNGNISANPQFAGKNNYRLTANSPAINVGDNSAPDLPKKDIAGKPRIVGGTVDLGAYEFQ
jgi:hypothetical protein